ncbi:MAG: hypothetical protein DRN90_00215 [Thermoproteota archaeon]|nr:MAG: hypothetical protein DRN90_00215 [Candidatus Korarchaeota archaeon]
MLIEEKILRKLFSDGSLEVTSDTRHEEFSDWESILKPLAEAEGAIVVKPLDLVDYIESALRSLCKKIAEAETDYPATWENYSSVELYYCTRPSKAFVVLSTDSDPYFATVRFNVHKNARSAVRDYNSTIDQWRDTLADHSTLDVPGAEESAEIADELKHEKLKIHEVLEKIKSIL